MTKQHTKALLSSEGCKVWFTEEPEYLAKDREYSQALSKYDADYKIWLSSYQLIPFADGQIQQVILAVLDVCPPYTVEDTLAISKATESDLDITKFVEVKRVTGEQYKYPSELRLFFKPPVEVEETPYVSADQAKMWVDVIEEIRLMLLHKTTTHDCTVKLVTNFHITRK